MVQVLAILLCCACLALPVLSSQPIICRELNLSEINAENLGSGVVADAAPMETLDLWGKTRIEALQEHLAQEKSSSSYYNIISYLFPMDSCSFFSTKEDCIIHTSPFVKAIVWTSGKGSTIDSVSGSDDYHRDVLLTLAVAGVVFLVAPRASHSLYCYYLTGSLLTSFLCIVILVYIVVRRFAGPKTAVLVGFLSWGGTVWLSMARELLYSRWTGLIMLVSAFIGFLLAYNYPPSARGQFSMQLVLQFCSLLVIYTASPSYLEAMAQVVGLVVTYLLMPFGLKCLGWRGRGARRSSGVAAAAAPQGEVANGEDEALMELRSTPMRRSGGAGAATRSTPRRTRLAEKRFLEQNYVGPLKSEVRSKENPFYCRGAAEYISMDEYRRQASEYTRQQEAELLEYMRREGLARKAHLLSPEARRGFSEVLANMPSPADSDDLDMDEY